MNMINLDLIKQLRKDRQTIIDALVKLDYYPSAYDLWGVLPLRFTLIVVDNWVEILLDIGDIIMDGTKIVLTAVTNDKLRKLVEESIPICMCCFTNSLRNPVVRARIIIKRDFKCHPILRHYILSEINNSMKRSSDIYVSDLMTYIGAPKIAKVYVQRWINTYGTSIIKEALSKIYDEQEN